MKILELYAEDFGKLCDRRFLPGEGLTLFEGPNESGKSTLLAMIRFLFYGFAQRSIDDRKERDNRLSWRGRCAAGQVRFISGGETFLLARRYTLRGGTAHERPAENMSLTRLPGGEDVDTGNLSPGEYFFGLPAELFDSSVCVRQSDIERVGAPDVRAAVGSVLFSGEGDFSIEAAQKRLDNARRELQHSRGRGGKIPETEDRLSDVTRRLATARGQAEKLAACRAMERRYAAEALRLAAARQAADDALTAAQLDRQLAGCAALRDARLRAETAAAALREAEEKAAAAHWPDSAFFSRMDGLLGEYEGAGATLAGAARQAAELHRMQGTPQNAETHRIAVWVGEQGGPDKTAEKYARLRAKCKIHMILAVILLLSAAGATALSLLPGLAPFVWIGAGLLGASAAVFFCLSVSCRRRAAAWWAQTGAPSGVKLDVYLTRLVAKDLQEQDDGTALLRVDLALESARERRADLEKNILDAFPVAGQSRPDSIENAKLRLAELRSAAEMAEKEVNGLRLAWEREHGAEVALTDRLPAMDEETLRARRAALPPVTESIEVLSRRREELDGAWHEADLKHREAEQNTASLSAMTIDPDETERERVALVQQLQAAKMHFDAVGMAMEALREAGESLRSGVIPKVNDDASALFAVLTGGAYDGLRVGDGFAVSLDTPNGPLPISHFSAGCRDAAYLSLRLALLKTLSAEKLPLFLDEALARLDDERAAAFVKTLRRYAEDGGQVLLFTCHTRERRMLADAPGLVCLSLSE